MKIVGRFCTHTFLWQKTGFNQFNERHHRKKGDDLPVNDEKDGRPLMMVNDRKYVEHYGYFHFPFSSMHCTTSFR
jgi:hypothetical protein